MVSVDKVDQGLYRLSEGESPRDVALTVYGDGNLYQRLLVANENWGSEPVVVVPFKQGRVTVVQPDDDLRSLIGRMFPNQPRHLYLSRYFDWNADTQPNFLIGEEVFIPER